MTTVFPTSLDSFTNPNAAGGDTLASVPHDSQHANINDAVKALETKVGIDSSAVTTSLDYLLKNSSSVDPGHKHSAASLNINPGLSSFTSTNSTLTIGGSLTAPTIDLNLAHANTWTGKQIFNTTAPTFGTMTAGSVLFAGTGGLLSQDNTNFFWDDTNNRLGIGTTTPGTGLIYGALNTAFHNFSSGLAITATQSMAGAGLTYTEGVGNSIVAIADSSASSNFKILDILSSGGKMVFRRLTDAYSMAIANALAIDYTVGDNNGYIGINTTTPATRVNIIDTEDFRIGHTGATGDLLVGMAMYTATGNTNLSIFGNGSAGGNTGTLQLMYTGGTGGNTYYSAAEIQNTASGFGNLRLMKSGGTVTVGGTLNITGLISKYNNVNTAGLGVPSIYGAGRSTGQTAAVASVATYTVGAADGSFCISANANVTSFVAGTFNVTVAYTDETNTAQTLKLNFSSLTGTIGIAIAASGPFEGIPAHIRCKASTAITVATSGTFTSITYNVEGIISQLQ